MHRVSVFQLKQLAANIKNLISITRQIQSARVSNSNGSPTWISGSFHRCISSHADPCETESSYPLESESEPADLTIPADANELIVRSDDVPAVPSEAFSRLLNVAVIGLPNSGKSTLINQLIGRTVCSVSKKVHTTRYNARAILNEGNSQIVILDTPGIVSKVEAKKFNISDPMYNGPEKSLIPADVIAVLHDIGSKWSRDRLHWKILRLLALYPDKPSILILNKVDILTDKGRILKLTTKLTDGVVGGRLAPVAETSKGKLPNYASPSAVEDILRKYQELRKKESKPAEDKVDAEGSSNISERLTQLADTKVEGKQKTSPVSVKMEKPVSVSKDLLSDALPGTSDDLFLGPDPREEYFLASSNFPKFETEKELIGYLRDKDGWPYFNEVFMISALTGDGVDKLKDYFVSKAWPRRWIYKSNAICDKKPKDLVLEFIRAKMLDFLDHNIPYELKLRLVIFDVNESGFISVVVQVTCTKQCMAKIVLGPGGSKIKRIAQATEQDLRNAFQTDVSLKLDVHLKEIAGSKPDEAMFKAKKKKKEFEPLAGS